MLVEKLKWYTKKIKRYLIKIQKHNQEIDVDRFTLIAPIEHKLESYLNWFKYYSRNLPRIAGYIEKKYPSYTIIDIGANIGDSVALFRSVGINQQIYAVEGEPSFYKLLLSNIEQFENVHPFQCFLGEESGDEQMVMKTEEGTSQLLRSETGGIKMLKLDDFINQNINTEVKLVKIDTDGFDLKIIRGGFEAIARLKPVLFFEYDSEYLNEHGDDGIKIFEQLAGLGYNQILYYDNFGKFLIAITTKDSMMIEQLYCYINKKEGAFHYYDLCVFHQDDDDLARDVIQKEMAFFK
ncbi:MAG: FkbM family methyltransferase [Sphingobacteriaceae bacterium]|nr:FkbM family methyltransferase [Sphingobacteriaceae bacterium]